MVGSRPMQRPDIVTANGSKSEAHRTMEHRPERYADPLVPSRDKPPRPTA
ncbi:MAG: hypothetical protein ACI85K_002407 [Hyphomicrobiaceae bacterium]|jgi:hypothetical protein